MYGLGMNEWYFGARARAPRYSEGAGVLAIWVYACITLFTMTSVLLAKVGLPNRTLVCCFNRIFSLLSILLPGY